MAAKFILFKCIPGIPSNKKQMVFFFYLNQKLFFRVIRKFTLNIVHSLLTNAQNIIFFRKFTPSIRIELITRSIKLVLPPAIFLKLGAYDPKCMWYNFSVEKFFFRVIFSVEQTGDVLVTTTRCL